MKLIALFGFDLIFWIIRDNSGLNVPLEFFINVPKKYGPSSYPYLITAGHLTGKDTRYYNWKYELNSQLNTCGLTFIKQYITSGFKVIFCPTCFTPTDLSEDYLILQANETVSTLQAYIVGFAGWDASYDYTAFDSDKNPYVGFHHPVIGNSWDKQYFISDHRPIDQSGYWRINVSTGFTSPGSSSSGLFSKSHELVGISITGANYFSKSNRWYNSLATTRFL